MTQPNSQLTKRSPGAIIPDGKLYPEPVKSIITQHDDRPAQYLTSKRRGQPPQPVPLPKLPAILPLTLSAIIALCFLVAASMFSIALTSYSNSVDRVNQNRTFMRID